LIIDIRLGPHRVLNAASGEIVGTPLKMLKGLDLAHDEMWVIAPVD